MMKLLAFSLFKSVVNPKSFLIVLSILSISNIFHVQTTTANYPKINGYVGTIHPILTYSSNIPAYNFDGAYVGGLRSGINIWKSAKTRFSFEFVPFIRAADGSSKMSNFLFHPVVLFGLGKGYTLATRAAFETSIGLAFQFGIAF